MVQIVAHRGASGTVPENTLLACFSAIAQGADMIEFDVQITRDEELVLFHDRNLARITGETQSIADFSLRELMQKDVGKWKDARFTGLKIPKFQDVMELLPSDISLIIEVKPQNHPKEHNNKLETLILEVMDDNRGVGNGYISVRDEQTYQFLSENCSYPLGLMQKKRSHEEFLDLVKKYNIGFSQIRIGQYNTKTIEELKQTQTKIMVYFADDQHSWDKLLSWGVDGILTNYPGDLKGYVMMKSSLKNH